MRVSYGCFVETGDAAAAASVEIFAVVEQNYTNDDDDGEDRAHAHTGVDVARDDELRDHVEGQREDEHSENEFDHGVRHFFLFSQQRYNLNYNLNL